MPKKKRETPWKKVNKSKATDIDLSSLTLGVLKELSSKLFDISTFLPNQKSIENFLEKNGATEDELFFDFEKNIPIIKKKDGAVIHYDRKKYHVKTRIENTDGAIKNIFSGLLDSLDKETNEKFKEQIALLKENLESDPEDIQLRVFFQIENILRQIYSPEVVRIAANWNMFSEHLNFVIKKFEGDACHVDKSRWLLNQYIEYKETGREPDMKKKDGEYWKPGFGTWEMWCAFIDGINGLLYGKFNGFLEAYKEILEVGTKLPELG